MKFHIKRMKSSYETNSKISADDSKNIRLLLFFNEND